MADEAKKSQYFSVGSRIATGSADHPLHFEFAQADSGIFDVRYSLSEQGREIASDLESPSHALKQFFHAAQHVFDEKVWSVEYSRQNREMHFCKADEKIIGTVESGNSVCLKSNLTLKRPRARGWLKGFESELLKPWRRTAMRSFLCRVPRAIVSLPSIDCHHRP